MPRIAHPEIIPAESPRLGGHGPTHPPTGGHDDWDNQPQGSRGPRECLNRYRIGVGVAMVAIFMVFIALTSAYIIRQDTGHIDFTTQTYVRDWRPLTLPPILLINSLILLLSSVTIEFARRSAFHEAAVLEDWLGISRQIAKRSLPWLLLTLMLGLGFLLGQFFAWQELRAAGVFMNTNPSHAFFYAFTGLHAVHLFGGILALFWAVISGFTARHLEQRQIAIDTTAWYWHGMGALWLYIYTLLYFAR